MFVDPLPEPPKENSRKWAMCPNVIHAHREALERVIDMSADEPYVGDSQPFGVVIAGGGSYFLGSVLCARMFREIGYTGPIEIWYGHHFSPEPVIPEMLDGLDVTLVNALEVMKTTRPRRVEGFGAKIHAIRNCRFRRVLFVDADAYPVDHNILWFVDEHASTPLSYWIDFPAAAKNVHWQNVGIEYRFVPQVQGGQLLVNRKLAWQSIVITDWICQHSDYFFHHMFGDQDAIRVALSMTDTDYFAVGPVRWINSAIVCDYRSQPVIVHRVHSKPFHITDAKDLRQYFTYRKDVPFEDKVYDIYLELERKYSTYLGRDAGQVFRNIYDSNLWQHKSSVDFRPKGHTLSYVSVVTLIAEIAQAKSIVDVGCGTCEITKAIAEATGCDVLGIDVVDVRLTNWKSFKKADVRNVDEIPECDILLAKDVLQHWSNRDIDHWLSVVINSGKCRWLVLTNDREQHCHDTYLGGFRALDPDKEPMRKFGPWKRIDYAHKSIAIRRCRNN